ncbi:MAG TPA: hypothetical protein VI032_17050 [Burkholderiaceae bacterium]
MPFALSAVAHRFNADMLADLPVLQAPKFPPPPPEPPVKSVIDAKSLAQLADDWCGTVPRKFPFPVPPKGGLDDIDWCGTKPRPLPGPIPPTPPQPWLDLGAAAQSFR